MDGEDAEPEPEVLAEPSLANLELEVPVGRRHDPGGAALLAAAPHPAEPARVQEGEQLRLQGQRQLADLVEEERPAVGQLERPGARATRAGERALLVAEELALDEDSGSAAQFTRTNGASSPAPSACTWRASTSLPAPVGPSRKTGLRGEVAMRSSI